MSDLHTAASESSVAILAKISVPTSITALAVSGVTVNQVLIWVTLIYTAVMLAHKLWSWHHEVKAKREEAAHDDQ